MLRPSLLLLACLFLINTVSLQGAVSAPPPVTVETGAKLVPADNSYVIVLSSRTIWVVRYEDMDRFLSWARSTKDPHFRVIANRSPEYPYKLIDIESGNEFLLKKPQLPNQWYVTVGEVQFYYLVDLKDNTLILQSTDSDYPKKYYWQLDFAENNKYLKEWRPKDTIIITPVFSSSNQGKSMLVGNLLYRFGMPKLTLGWMTGGSNQVMGLWAHQISEPSEIKK